MVAEPLPAAPAASQQPAPGGASGPAPGPELAGFAAGYPFGLDAFQLDACAALEAGDGVLVCAPTGAGKTVVGEFAVHLALAQGKKCFYTTPIKALSNQKYADLVARHGAARVGLLTGDTAVNGHAPVVVMTTEVLRNMLYAGSTALDGLGYVVMDEVHYLADRFRGAVWEEVIVHLPRAVRLVSLSATVSNAEEFAEWLVTVRGDTRVVLEEHRPVPLWQHVLTSSRLYDLFLDGTLLEVSPSLLRLAREEQRLDRLSRSTGPGAGRPRHLRGSARGMATRGSERTPGRVEVVKRLDAEGLLPAIVFVFSRAGCDAAVQQCLAGGLRLTTAAEREQVRRVVAARTGQLPREDLRVLGYDAWVGALERGIAAHHAGLLPAFKEVVEDLFSRGLVKAVFATETLALGINMPARSVVLEKLSKWNGETHADVTPGEFTQLTGRAGRRGIDVEGHAVVLWQPGLDPSAVAGLASTRTYPLRSSFRPSYNMAVNLVGAVGRARARELLESSFAQFQADRGVVGLARQVARNTEALAGYREAMTCHLGDLASYDGIRRRLGEQEAQLAREGSAQRRAAAVEALERLRPGDVIKVPSGRHSGLAVVLDTGVAARSPSAAARGAVADGPRPVALTTDRQVVRLTVADLPAAVEVLGRLRIPKAFSARSPQSRRDLAQGLRAFHPGAERGAGHDGARRRRGGDGGDGGPAADIARLRAELRAHPVHGCSEREDHLRWADRHASLARDTDRLRARMAGRTSSIARTFDSVCSVLTTLGYLAGEAVTPAGEQLARVYAETDLLVVEGLRRGAFDGLDAPGLAAVVSTLVYESRRPEEPPTQQPPASLRAVVDEVSRLWAGLQEREAAQGLATVRAPDPGFAWAAYHWAGGADLETTLAGAEIPAGDFVRWVRQLVDLLSQLALVAAPTSVVRRTARDAVAGLRRGVVAYAVSG